MGTTIEGGLSAVKRLRSEAFGVATALAVLTLATTGALAQSQTQASFDVSAQSLTAALPLFGQQAGIQVSVDGDLVSDLRTNGVTGSMSVEAALQQLLAGTGLTYRFTAADSVTLERVVVQPESGPVRLEPVTVTARRTEELLQDVPGSVVVLTGEELERSNIDNTTDALSRLPNVGFIGGFSPDNLVLSIRGISNTIGGNASAPTNGVFADGILLNPSGDRAGINPNLVDLERVETIFGPQGTAFGRGTIGGAINFVTRKPTDEFEASLETELGSYPDGRATAIVNAPIVEEGLLSARLVAFGGISDGYIDFENEGDPDSIGSDDVGARLSLRSQPTDRLTLDGSVSFDRSEFDARNSVEIDVLNGNLATGADFVEENSLDRLLASLQWTYDFDVGSLRSTTAVFRTELDRADDFDFTDLDFAEDRIESEERTVSQEFRFESERFTLPWQAGRLTVNLGSNISFTESTSNNVIDPGEDAFAPNGLTDDGSTITTRQEQNLFNLGVFGDLRWQPIPNLEIAAGARVSRDRVKQNGETLSSGLSALTVPPVPFNSDEAVFTSVTPNVSIKYDWTEDFSTYFAFATGYRPGGFAQGLFGTRSFEEETARSFEGGFRASLFSDRLLVNGSGFLIDYDDILVNAPDTAGGVTDNVIRNAAGARSVGAEIGISTQPLEGLRIDAQNGLTFAKYTDFTDSPQGDLTDTRLPLTPVHTVSIVGDYEHPREVLPDARGFFRVEYSYRSSFTAEIGQDEPTLDGFDIVNLRLGLRGEGFGVEAFVENALDERYATNTSVSASSAGSVIVQAGPPRHFGVRARLQF
ncbi:TonB-dependent receptor domain-containing protein [Algihabitans sp.]|uniref:TonB-dependent receptor domain-containing protein n=1 Tax=Algihabitans sp. TaxID=2821514 RepID=UPI003BABCA17